MQVFTEELTATGRLTAYVQDPSDELASAATRPAMLVLPGGGYRFCSDREAEPVALAYLAQGFNCFVLRYAVGEHPWTDSFADGVAALEWIRDHADEVNVDPEKVAVVGFSAGGHLAASLGVSAPCRPDALVLGYPVTLAEFGPPVGKEFIDCPSHVDELTPPTFLFSTQGDTLVPIRNSLRFLTALAEHDIAFESHIYLLGPHGLSLATAAVANGRAAMVDDSVSQWLTDSVTFLRRIFGDFAVAGEAEVYADLLERRRPGLDMPVNRLLADDALTAVLDTHLPAEVIAALRSDGLAWSLSLRDLSGHQPELLNARVLEGLERDLHAVRN